MANFQINFTADEDENPTDVLSLVAGELRALGLEDIQGHVVGWELKDKLLAYSEWLDSEGLVVSDQGKDKRSHDELVTEFMAQWTGRPLEGTH